MRRVCFFLGVLEQFVIGVDIVVVSGRLLILVVASLINWETRTDCGVVTCLGPAGATVPTHPLDRRELFGTDGRDYCPPSVLSIV